MKADAGVMPTPPYAADQTTYIFSGTDWEGYAQEGTRAGENLKRGYEPLETFPAKWHNTVMNRFSIAIQQAKVALDNIYNEMRNIMTATEDNAGQPITPQIPSAGDVTQVLKAIRNITKLHKATASILGGVLSSAEAWKVAVGTDGKMSVNTKLATTTDAGLVKSAATGTDPARTYNVEVKTDGTMKVCVPWTDTHSQPEISSDVLASGAIKYTSSTWSTASYNYPTMLYISFLQIGFSYLSGVALKRVNLPAYYAFIPIMTNTNTGYGEYSATSVLLPPNVVAIAGYLVNPEDMSTFTPFASTALAGFYTQVRLFSAS